jgi:hypothetical protein
MNSIAREPAAVSGSGGPGGGWSFDVSARGSTSGPAIASWPGATLSVIPAGVPAAPPPPPVPPGDGRCILAVKVTDNGDGTWHYEYALYNHDMDRGVRTFTVPVGAATVVSHIGFSAPLSHDDGAAYHNNAWAAARQGVNLTWSTDVMGSPGGSNPLRWGTLYNFRFDANHAPVGAARATLGLFKPGAPAAITGATQAPAACPPDVNADGTVDVQDFLAFLALYAAGDSTADLNADGSINVQDFLAFLSLFAQGCR